MRPRHIVIATGVSGIPNIPDIPALKNFRGPVLHSSQYRDGEDWSGKRAIVIGTDAPGVDSAYLRDAARLLSLQDVVIGPALDGGYTLIGLRRPAAGLFEGIAWSTAHVLTQTRAAMRRLGLAHAELAALPDIDEPEDLQHLPAAWHPAFPS